MQLPKQSEEKLRTLYNLLVTKPKLSDFFNPFLFCDCLTTTYAYKLDIVKSAYTFLRYLGVPDVTLEQYKVQHGTLLRNQLYRETYKFFVQHVRFLSFKKFHKAKPYISRADELFVESFLSVELNSLSFTICPDLVVTVRILPIKFCYINPPFNYILYENDAEDTKAREFYKFWCLKSPAKLETFSDTYIVASFVDL